MFRMDKPSPLGKGYVQVYTGNGKGKSTAAFGLAFRAMGQKLRTYIGQFIKGQHCSELEAARMAYPYITIEQYGKNHFVQAGKPSQEDLQLAREGIERAKAAMLSNKYDIVILDEFITAYSLGLVSLKEVLEVTNCKPEGLELVLTGRQAPPELIGLADLVTEMVEVKHYYQKGILAREGIEH